MSEISWIKLKTTMFDDEKIRLIQAVPESDSILVIWIRLLVLAGKTNDDGLIYIQRNMPYSEEMLATLFSKPVNTIRLALQTLANFNMIDLNSDGSIAITNWEKHQNIEGMEKVRYQNRLRKQKQREKQRLISDNAGQSRDSHATDIDKELDIDIDKEIKDIEKKTKKKPKVIRHKYGEYQNVLLSDDQLKKLQDEFPSDWEQRIDRVSSYCESTGKSYKNYLATIRNWAKKDTQLPKSFSNTRIEKVPAHITEQPSKSQKEFDKELAELQEQARRRLSE